MDMEYLWLVIIAVIVPIFFWYRVREMNRRKEMVHTRCFHCHADQKLKKVMNYSCTECGKLNRFFDDEGIPMPSARRYDCLACGSENFVGILTCRSCGKANQAGIPT